MFIYDLYLRIPVGELVKTKELTSGYNVEPYVYPE